MKALIVFTASIAFLITLSCKKSETPLPIPGNKAPSFILKDVQGSDLRLSDLSGKIVIMDFWATWCHSCKELTTALDALQRQYKRRDVVVLGISMDRGSNAVRTVQEYSGKNSLGYVMLMDDGKASKVYAVHNIPVTYILDKNHIITKKYVGYMPKLGEMIDEQIKHLIEQ